MEKLLKESEDIQVYLNYSCSRIEVSNFLSMLVLTSLRVICSAFEWFLMLPEAPEHQKEVHMSLLGNVTVVNGTALYKTEERQISWDFLIHIASKIYFLVLHSTNIV